ncbi:MAG: hypothetical protein ACRCXM_13105 [Beijerinckiaceae bacterium]
MILTFFRLLPRRIVNGITLFAEAVADARAMQKGFNGKYMGGFDS